MIPLIALEVLGQAWLVLFGVVIILGLALLFGMSPINPRPADTRKSKKHDGTVTDANIIASLKSELNWVNSRIDKKDLLIEELKMSLRRGNLSADKYLELKPRIVVAQIALRQVREYLQSIGNLSQEQASLLSSVKQSLNFINEEPTQAERIKGMVDKLKGGRPIIVKNGMQEKLYFGADLSEGEAAKMQRLYSGTWLDSDAPHDLTGSDPIFEKETEEAGKAAKLNFEPVAESEITGMFLEKGLGKSPTRRWTSAGSHLQNLPKSESVKWWLGLNEDVQASLGDKYNLTPECVISEEVLAKMHKDWLCGQSPLKCTDPDCSVCYADRNASSPEAEDQKVKERPSWETPDGTQYGIDLAADPEEKTKVTRKKRIKYYDEALKWWNGLDEPTRIELRTEYDIPAMLTPSELDLVDIWNDEN